MQAFEQRWQAVARRDRTFDRTFVYAVRSTGVYCRPSCPSRRPRPAQVVFFESPAAAENAGFRPCRRCRPQAAQDRHSQVVTDVCRYIESHLGERLDLQTLGREARLSPFHLQRVFRTAMGVTPRQYAATLRLRAAQQALKRGSSVTEALYEAGYGSSSRLYETSAGRLGMTPGAYRQGGKNMQIAYTIVSSPLGRVLVAGTEHGLSMVSLGDRDEPLVQALREEYPEAEIRPARNGLREWARAIIEQLRGERQALDLPLDVRGTAFQTRVWEALRKVPYGATRTYSQLARSLNRPTATRAVARACATNPVSIVVPCHRIIREDGGLGGYRWGLERKRKMLQREQGR
jgi:AraC family transcriptional regulator of adaptative response/methylated-DNA-[protein]-cysteine methyltransferase